MKFLSNLKELITKNISIQYCFLLAVSIVLLYPYFILSYFDNPSIDDYSFALKTRDIGFWHAQSWAYTTWNGRYFASFILFAHPLFLGSLLLYKILPVLLIIMTAHSVYYFISNCFDSIDKVASAILSLLITFMYLNKMPSLVQGIYWAPGAITYQFANIIMLYFFTNIVRIATNTGQDLKRLKIISGILVLAVCGLNETSMIAIMLSIGSFLLYYLLFEKRINKLMLIYFILGLAGALVLVSSPGNIIRDAEYTFPNEKNIFFTIFSSFKAAFHSFIKWGISRQIIIISLLSVIFYFTGGRSHLAGKKSALQLLFVAVCGSLIVTATFSSGFWSIGQVAPDRTLNVTYWLFMLLWFTLVFMATAFITSRYTALIQSGAPYVILLSVMGLLLTINPLGNYYNACKDIVSGKAYTYNKEWRARVKTFNSSQGKGVCEIPSFSVFPNSIFNEDIKEDASNWWNQEYSRYYHVEGIKVKARETDFLCKYFLNFDTEESKKLQNGNSITSELFFSSPYSSLQNGPETYSVIFEKLIGDLDIDSPSEITGVNLNAQIYSTDSIVNYVMVVVFVDPLTGKQISWNGKEISKSNNPKNTWTNETFIIPFTDKSTLNPSFKVSVYMWNRGKGKVYMDDLHININ